MTVPTPSHFECSHCGATWAAAPGPQTCPRCKGMYSKWLDFPGSSVYDHDYPGKPLAEEKSK